LFGWSFMPDWEYRDALEVEPDSVGRPEHYRAIDGMGYRVWSNASTIGEAFVAAGVPATVLYDGRPRAPEPVPAKDVDVVTIGANRWRTITRRALEGFRGTWRELPEMDNDELMREVGRGQVLVHCPRIEGHSRIAIEARLMGTCCVGLASNRFAVGFDEAFGGFRVDRPEEVPAVLERLLADPAGLRGRQERGRAQAMAMTDWDAYVRRVGEAVSAVESDLDAAKGPWRTIAGELATRERVLEAELAAVKARRSVRAADALGRLRKR
jgi:hypothetical protein